MDTGPAMAVWRRLETELLDLFHRLGAFRDLQKWYLRTAEGEVLGVSRTPQGDPRGHSGRGGEGPTAIRHHAELTDPARRVILLLTDAASQAWYSGAITPVLERWASSGPVAIIQPLPQQLWARTGLSPVQGRVSCRSAVAPNTELGFRPLRRASRPFAWAEPDSFDGPDDSPDSPRRDRMAERDSSEGLVPIPVLGLGPEWLADWARFIVSPAGAELDCTVTLASGPQPARFPPPLRADTLQDRVRRFAEQASPEALQLAIYFSATELSLPVMRHVQAVMLPSSGPSHLAEVLLGGLLFTRDAARSPHTPEEWRYEFAEGARELLYAGLGRSQARRVVYLVSKELEARFGLGADEFTAAHAAPETPGNRSLPLTVKPFAEITRQLLERIDGRFTTDLRPAEQPIPATATPRERAALLIDRYQRTGRVRDLDEAIEVLRGDPFGVQAADDVELDPHTIVELARALRFRFSATRSHADLDEAADILDDAVSSLPPGAERGSLLAEHSTVFGLRYALTGDLADLDSAVTAVRAAIADTTPAGAAVSARPRYATALGSLLLRRARANGSAADLDEAIEWLREPDGSQRLEGAERARIRTNLATALRLRAAAGEPAGQATRDLSDAIEAIGEALKLTPDSGREQAARRNELAAGYAARADITQSAADLRAAADAYRHAAENLAASTADRAEGLAGLGSSLCALARRGEPAPLPEAVRSLRAAVSQTPADDAARPRRLAALADALLQRFALNHSRTELTEAADLLERAAAGAPPGSDERAGYLAELGLTYERRYRAAQMPQDLGLAANALRQAAAIKSFPDITSIQTSYARILVAQALYGEAGKVLQDVVTRLAGAYGQDDPRTLAARLELARAFTMAGMTADAVAVLDDLIPEQIRVHGPDSQETHAARDLRHELPS